MARTGGRITPESDLLRYADYSPKSNQRSGTDKLIDSKLIAVGFGVAVTALAGRYAFHLWKPLGQVLTDTTKKFSASAFSAYYKGGFEQNMTKREAGLILGISATSAKAKVREAHLRIMAQNHPDKGGSLYLATKINKAREVLESGHRS